MSPASPSTSPPISPPLSRPFKPSLRVSSLADVHRLEQVPIEQAIPVRSTYEIFRNSAHAFGGKTALTFLRSGKVEDEPIRWSYAQLLNGIHQTANLLHRLGVQPTDAVAVLLPGCLEYHLALWGGEAAAIVQPLNPLLNDQMLAALMRSGRARVLFAYGSDAESGLWSKALRLRGLVPTLTHVLRIAPHDEPPGSAGPLPEGVLDFAAERALEADDRLVSGRAIAPGDIAAYFHTGGTTGAPKIARHSHGAQVFTAWASANMQDVSPSDVTINGFPLFHVAGVLPSALTALSAGMETIIPTPSLLRNREAIANYWRLVEKYRATTLSAVPTVLAALANVPLAGADISTIRYFRTGAAPLPPELAARFKRLFGLHLHESLGMTEMTGISTITPPGVEGPPGSVGFRVPYSQLRIVALEAGEPTGPELPPGKTGMVLFKSPNLFSGYLDAEDTAKAFTPDGWLITGDLGWLDAQGRLNLSGRAKDLIIRGGHNIDPKLIEDALAAHPAVELCAAVGAPDAYAGELPVVFATLRPGASASTEELLAFAAEHVAEPPARPRRVTIVDRMPTTNVGKIFKPELRQRAALDVVAALVDKACRELDVPAAMRPQVQAGECIDILLPTGAPQTLHERLQRELVRLPVKTALQRGS